MTQAQKDEVKLHYQRATRAYDLQKYLEAIDEYQKAYEISGDPPMLYNIAQAYRLADQPAEAVRYYRRFLQRMPNARNREDVERKIADQEKLAEQRRKVEPVDAAAVHDTDEAAADRRGEAAAADHHALDRTGGAAGAARRPEPSNTRAIVGWILVGVGVIVGGVGGYEAYVAKQKSDQLTNDSRMMRDEDVRPGGRDRGQEREHRRDRARHRRHRHRARPGSSSSSRAFGTGGKAGDAGGAPVADAVDLRRAGRRGRQAAVLGAPWHPGGGRFPVSSRCSW